MDVLCNKVSLNNMVAYRFTYVQTEFVMALSSAPCETFFKTEIEVEYSFHAHYDKEVTHGSPR